MDLVTRGRLSVQRVGEDAWKAIGQLAEKGGWEEMDLKPTATKKRKEKAGSDDGPSNVKTAPKRKSKPAKPEDLDQNDSEPAAHDTETPLPTQKRQTLKRKRQDTESNLTGLRRSTRTRA